MIKTRNLTKRVAVGSGEISILKGINLEIKAGESVAIVGPSGSGKSTLLGLMAGLDLPTEGDIWLNGEKITGMDEDQRAALRGRNVGFVFQSFQLLPGLTALENVMLPLELAGHKQVADKASEFLARVGLGERCQHYPRQLSGGEQQRVALARAFAASPKILFADEPTGNLDAETGTRVNDLLFEMNSHSDTTLVLVTHEPGLAARCGRRISLQAGAITADDGCGEAA